ncbi:hypothetical protein E0Z10_g913 [Xylaria hypoxylon]|uniref:CBM-cenC domain-containing protein n=1 Tax=Xylaria hypoxylon TaxID=37992 RepID=A0A4Z0YTX6_9PEZI|nr:hypothetical protein E0Z10_g913 [Xylaria hypoxylon]
MTPLSLSFGRKLLAAAMLLAFTVSAGCNGDKCYRAETSTLSKVTATARSTSSTLTQDYFVPNGDFECGLTPWTVEVPDAAASYFLGAPGHTTSNSFQVRFTPPTRGTQFGVSARIISAPVRVVPNVAYRLNFWTYFDNQNAGFIGVKFNGVARYTIDATDHGWGGDFTSNTVDYTPTNETVTITFEYLFVSTASLDRIDSVVFAPVQ